MLDKIIDNITKPGTNSIIAIDGRCASGKTTLSNQLKPKLDCNVIHLDDFFLRPHQRTEERLNTPGGNIDYERFLKEVLNPLKTNQPFSYRPYDCKSNSLGNEISVLPKDYTIIEGSYACHTKFIDFFDYKIFMDIDPEEQLKRIKERNGKIALKMFSEKWIPLEEKYFNYYKISKSCNLIIKNNEVILWK